MKKNIIAAIAVIGAVLVLAAAAFVLLNDDGDRNSLDELPDGLRETDVEVNAGGRWELPGKITTNAETRNDAAAVIVQGSGPSDMDGTYGKTYVYRDLAWGLAQYDIDVLRYDKRTYVYGAASADNIAKITVMEETINDAIAAAELLRDLGYERVILIGHSMGGMLAPAIVKESGGLFDGFVSLAGSPRTMPEIQADQNLALANPLNISYIKEVVAGELKKLEDLGKWTESQLLSETIFGLPGYYVKDMISRDAGQIALSLDVPMLFLQGSEDVQVYADKDFAKWQEILNGKEGAGFKLYDGLDHMFMDAQTGSGTQHVSWDVIRDIAEFITE